jgi:hypothetical protein
MAGNGASVLRDKVSRNGGFHCLLNDSGEWDRLLVDHRRILQRGDDWQVLVLEFIPVGLLVVGDGYVCRVSWRAASQEVSN